MAASLGVVCALAGAAPPAGAVKSGAKTSFSDAATRFNGRPKATNLGGRVGTIVRGHKLKGGALKAMISRSGAGDVEGARDAIKGLETMRSGGNLGLLGQLQLNKARGKTATSSLQASQKLARGGQLGQALESHGFAVELKGSSRASKKVAREIHSSAWQQAERLAKGKDPQATREALGHAREAAKRAGLKFNEKKAAKLEKQASRLGLRGRIARALDRRQARGLAEELYGRSRQLHAEERYDEAAEALLEAQDLQAQWNLSATMEQRTHTMRMMRHVAKVLVDRKPASP